MYLVIAEKPSVSRAIAEVIGAQELIMLMLCCSMIGVCGKYLYDYFAQSTENKNAYADIRTALFCGP